MSKFQMLKGALSLLAGIGIGNIVDDAIKMIQPTKQKGVISKLATKVGATVLSLFIVDKVNDHLEQQFDNVEEQIKEFIQGKPEKEVSNGEETE